MQPQLFHEGGMEYGHIECEDDNTHNWVKQRSRFLVEAGILLSAGRGRPIKALCVLGIDPRQRRHIIFCLCHSVIKDNWISGR